MITGENPGPSGCAPLFSMASACWMEHAWGDTASSGRGAALPPLSGSALRCGFPWEDLNVHTAGRLVDTL